MLENLVDFQSFPIKDVLPMLLKDKTTKKNIIFATTAYSSLGKISEQTEITEDLIMGVCNGFIQPRVCKSLSQQAERTRSKAEVFTPSWICNKMNNHCDSEWFGRENVFNEENEQTWTETAVKIAFPEGKTWKDYVDSRRLEITCGEAPYVVSRYDATSGEIIPITHRIGILDRKLRVVNENAESDEEWFRWVTRAYQSTYAFDWSGDNVILARANLLNTFNDYVLFRFDRPATKQELKKIANIISWNVWQMDGLAGTVPLSDVEVESEQITLFDYFGIEKPEVCRVPLPCRIYDWRGDDSLEYNSLKGR